MPAPDAVETTSKGPEQTGPSKAVQARELGTFLFLIVPSMVLSFFVIRTGSLDFVTTAVATMLRDIGLVALILFFLWRNGESPGQIGLHVRGRWREAALGILLFAVLSMVLSAVETLLQQAGASEPATKLPNFLEATGGLQLVLAVALVAVVAVAEETIFRGYLIHRLWAITGSRNAAVVLSSVLFALGHGYEGSTGVIVVGLMGFAFAVVYLWRDNLVAPITMHFAQDFISIVVLSYMQSHG